MRQISLHASTGRPSGRNRETFHTFNTFALKHLLGGGIILDAGDKSIKRPDKNLCPSEAYAEVGDRG